MTNKTCVAWLVDIWRIVTFLWPKFDLDLCQQSHISLCKICIIPLRALWIILVAIKGFGRRVWQIYSNTSILTFDLAVTWHVTSIWYFWVVFILVLLRAFECCPERLAATIGSEDNQGAIKASHLQSMTFGWYLSQWWAISPPEARISKPIVMGHAQK